MDKPNVLLITTDQQRYDSCGPGAPAFMRTPHFDVLARQGISYSRFYADCPICVPARASIMTGKYSHTMGLTSNGHTSEYFGRKGTLSTCMREMGYQTCAIGKMHFGPERTRHGFDEMILPSDYYNQMSKSGNPLQPMRHGLGQNELYPGMATVPESMTLTSWTAEQCIDYIKERRDPNLPFFLWCSFSKPHPPLDPPEPYYSMYRNCDIPEPVFGDWSEDDKAPPSFLRGRRNWSTDLIPPEIIREARSAYYGLITQIDYNMGRVFSALQDLDMFNDCLIVYTSDHGEFLGDHHFGGKFNFHDPAARVPAVVRLPRSWENNCAGSIVDDVCTHADLLPTILKAVGGEAPADVDGQDMTALARGALENKRAYLEGTMSGGRSWAGLTDGKWKYIWFPEGGYEQLFDLVNDPKELRNLSNDSGSRTKLDELKSELIGRLEKRNSELVADGKLVVQEIGDISEQALRANPWPGFHTEHFKVDVRH